MTEAIKLIFESKQDIPEYLRNIADMIESKEYEFENMTLVGGSEVFHVGEACDEQAVLNAIFNLNFAIQKLMHPAVIDSFEVE